MKSNLTKLLALLLCVSLSFTAWAEKNQDNQDKGKNDKDLDDCIIVYGMKLPKEAPATKGSLSAEDAKERFKKLIDLREKIGECYEKLEEIAKLSDSKKMKRKAQGELKKLGRLKKNFYKEAKKAQEKLEKPYNQLKRKLEALERQVHKAEEKGNAQKTAKLNKDLEKLNDKFQAYDDARNYLIYSCFFKEDEELAETLGMEIPGYNNEDVIKGDKKDQKDKDDDVDNDEPKKKKKKAKKDKDDDDDDDDDDKPKKKKKKSKKNRD